MKQLGIIEIEKFSVMKQINTKLKYRKYKTKIYSENSENNDTYQMMYCDKKWHESFIIIGA